MKKSRKFDYPIELDIDEKDIVTGEDIVTDIRARVEIEGRTMPSHDDPGDPGDVYIGPIMELVSLPKWRKIEWRRRLDLEDDQEVRERIQQAAEDEYYEYLQDGNCED